MRVVGTADHRGDINERVVELGRAFRRDHRLRCAKDNCVGCSRAVTEDAAEDPTTRLADDRLSLAEREAPNRRRSLWSDAWQRQQLVAINRHDIRVIAGDRLRAVDEEVRTMHEPKWPYQVGHCGRTGLRQGGRGRVELDCPTPHGLCALTIRRLQQKTRQEERPRRGRITPRKRPRRDGVPAGKVLAELCLPRVTAPIRRRDFRIVAQVIDLKAAPGPRWVHGCAIGVAL